MEIIQDNRQVEILHNALLADYTTFRLGGPCKGMILCTTPHQLELTVYYLNNNHFDFILIGGGSNLVVSDKGLDCYVVRYLSDNALIDQDGDDLIISGSTLLDHAALFAAEQGLEGLNYASGIPGTVGGAIVGNAGAFGRQIGDVIVSVDLMDGNGQSKQVQQSDLALSYRYSNLKETDDIVVSVRLRMKKGDKKELLKERESILSLRKEKHPDLGVAPCAGSFFRNIEPTSKAQKRQAAGWFLEKAGGKVLREGGACIFPKHANIIVKGDKCQAQDVYDLSEKMKDLVKKEFNLDLTREVRFVGPFLNQTSDLKNIIW